MASNIELQESIAARVEELGIDVIDTKDMNNVQLVAELKRVNELEAPKADDDAEDKPAPKADALKAGTAAEHERNEKDKPKAARYTVKPGGAITSLRGIIGEGEGCAAEDFNGGKDTFAALLKAGHIVDNK